MPSAVIGALRVDLDLNTAAFQAGAVRAERATQSLGRQMQTIGRGMTRMGQGMTLGITTPLAALVATSIPAATQARQALAQVEAANLSMGHAAGYSTEQLQAQATALMNLSNFDDDDILQRVTANMLTFGNVSGRVFERAQLAVVNLSARMGTDLQGATLMVGKALNAPITGLAAMRRVGIQFTEAQQRQIRTMVAANNLTGAQTVMLNELERQFGGAAAAQRRATPGQDAIQAWNEFQETVGEIALRILPPLSAGLAAVLGAFNELDPATQNVVAGIAAAAAAAGPLLMVFGPIIGLVGRLIPMFASLAASTAGAGAAAGAAGIGLAGIASALLPIAALAAAAYLAWQNWDTIAPMLANLWAWLERTFGPPLQSLLATISDVMTDLAQGPFGALLQRVGQALQVLGSIFVSVLGTALPPLIRGTIALLDGFFRLIGDGLNLVAALLTGDFTGAWEAAKAMVGNAMRSIGNIFEAIVPGIGNAVQRLYTSVKTWLVDKFWELVDLVMAPIRAIERGFAWLYDRVVGHSWVPDLVGGIADHMARLDQVMAEPARRAARSTEQAMREASQRSVEAVRQMREQLGGLLDRLFPEAAALRQIREEMALLDQAAIKFGMTAEQVAEARRRLVTENLPEDDQAQRMAAYARGEMPGVTDTDWWRDSQRDLTEYSERHMGQIIESFERYQEGARNAGRAFADMASQAIGSIRSIADAFRSGDFLSMVQNIMDLVMSVQGMIRGPHAAPSGATFKKAPGFARGGAFTVGGAPGTDANLVSMRLTKGERVDITPRGGAPGGRSMHFDLRGAVMTEDLLAQMNQMADGAATRGAVGGLRLAERQRHRKARRALGVG